jgi:malate dehydrogenase (oxaloacetate-decarboxylating)(NADP+)
LYCAAGGIAPHRVLPVTIDVGTNNEALLQDPDYIGLRHRRLEGDAYYDVLDEFMCAVSGRWPNALIQFEDFETSRAMPLLEKYRERFCCFNDDIQGTGAVVVAGLLTAAKTAGIPIKDLRILCAGAGSAGLGVCEAILEAMTIVGGVSKDHARKQFVVATQYGCLGAKGMLGSPNYTNNGSVLDMHLEWVNPTVEDGTSLLEAMKQHKPHVLLGLTACKGVFTRPLLEEMSKHSARPIVMPLSNPTSKAECTPAEAYEWTNGQAIVSTGSPYSEVHYPGASKPLYPSQCNNMYIFPGFGLAASVAGIQTFSDKMFFRAAEAVMHTMNQEEIDDGRTFPVLRRIREVSKNVAVALIKEAHEHKMTPKLKKHHFREGIEYTVARKMYTPEYVPLIAQRKVK